MVETKSIEDKKLWEAIFHRKSIRKYKSTPLDDETLSRVRNFLEELIPLKEDIKTRFMLIGPDDIKSLIPLKKAPHYIAAFSEKKAGYRVNIGFMLEQMDLFLSSQNIGSCWVGMAQPKKDILRETTLEDVILLSLGEADETVHRQEIGEFKRKKLEEISDMNEDNGFLEPARLAPSATNNQPWYFTGNENQIEVYCTRPNFIKARVLKKWNPIDMGIALYHLWLHFKVKGKNVEIITDNIKKDEKKGYAHIATVIIN
ncbi:MAG: nitroreductase [Euryarchaeota archaeon]|nr:nitroreductase [Euryarchaeota archaeon]MBU4607571.1 nitroreductase [Euryarchaeota archaeon]MBV1755890.1 nitroreductase [Methanobacterium sp.]MBV1768436.1 nitroreductase [Methanobacterium sp.]